MTAISQVSSAQSPVRAVGTESIIDRLERNARTNPNGLAGGRHVNGHVQKFTWAEYAAAVDKSAKALLAAGVKKGDKVCIFAANNADWVFSHFGAIKIGAVSVGAPPDRSGEAVEHILKDSGSTVLFVDNSKLWNKIAANVSQLPQLRHIVIMSNEDVGSAKTEALASFLAKGANVPDTAVAAAKSQVSPHDIAALVYTSGTSGPAKGVMLSQDNIAFAGDAYVDTVKPRESDRTVGALMFGHVADQTAALYGPISAQMPVLISNKFTLKNDLKEWRPTIMLFVPDGWDVLAAAIGGALGKISKLPGLGGVVANAKAKAKANAERYYATGEEPKHTPLIIGAMKWLAGLDKVRLAASGAAPLSASTANALAELQMPLFEAYGSSETVGVGTANLPGNAANGTVGSQLPGVNVWLGENNEIMVQGRNIAMGYLNNPSATAEQFKGDTYHTGDVGEIKDGHIKIVGRMSNQFKNGKGVFVQGDRIVQGLKGGVVKNAVVVGQGRDFNAALIVLDKDAARAVSAGADTANDPAVKQAVEEAVAKWNGKAGGAEKVGTYFIIPRDLKTGDDGEITPTLKIRSFKVAQNFASELDALYAAGPKF